MKAYSPRTNPLGKYLQQWYNFRTRLSPPEHDTSTTAGRLTTVALWFGLPITAYILAVNTSDEWRYRAQKHWMSSRQPKAQINEKFNYPEETKGQLHDESITSRQFYQVARHQYVFPSLAKGQYGHYHAHTMVQTRRANDEQDSTWCPGGVSHNVHRYQIAKPIEDYNAVKIKATFNLAAAAYYESRANLYFPKLQTDE